MKTWFLSTAAAVAMCGTALAADPPLRRAAPVFAPVPVFTWTGFYVGAQVGYAWGEDSTAVFDRFGPVPFGFGGVTGNVLTYDTDGFVGGVHAGFNYQFGSLVVGVEGDLEATGIEGNRTLTQTFFPGLTINFTSKSELDWQGSLRARVGFAADRALIYATGGLAVADMSNTYTLRGAFLGTTVTLTEKFSDTQWGWTVGAGVEYAFTNNLTARVEYRFTKFDDFNNLSNGTVFGVGVRAQQEPEFHTVRAGVSYKF
ncbi:MAG TPA: outer membrane protein [Beijerinckiaceae bacterium]|jgi:outer membrane immunogenic protein